jgi:hypothetical protein
MQVRGGVDHVGWSTHDRVGVEQGKQGWTTVVDRRTTQDFLVYSPKSGWSKGLDRRSEPMSLSESVL